MYNVVSLFSGAGGLDLGFHGDFSYLKNYFNSLDYKIINICEIDKEAIKTYNYNFQTNYKAMDINNFSINSTCDVVLGGFPCQDFSLAGKMMGLSSKRGNLYIQMIKVVETANPKVFVAENVENIIKMDSGNVIKKIIKDFEDIGYHVEYKLFDMSEYGIPQNRKRVFIIGIDKNFYNKEIEFFELDDYRISKKMTSFEAIDDLWGKTSINMQDKYSKAKFRENSKLQGNKRINKETPAPTIRAEHHGNIEGHYRTFDDTNPSDINNWRRLTPRECARLQTFPDEFIFPVSSTSAYRQIGNAVPPVFAWYMANNIRRILKELN